MAANEGVMEFFETVAAWTARNRQALAGYGASVVILVSAGTTNVPEK